MQILPPGISFTTYARDVTYLEARLLAYATTKAFAGPVTSLVHRGEDLRRRDGDTRRTLTHAQAAADVADAEIDDALTVLHADLHSEVVGDRKSETFKRVFPAALSDTIKYALETQLEVLEDVIKHLKDVAVSEALRDKHLGRLEELLAKGNAAQRVLDEAEEQRFQLSRALRRFKTDANAVRAAVHGSLVAIGPWGSRNRFWADRYFRKYTKKQLKTVVDEGEATEVDDESESDES